MGSCVGSETATPIGTYDAFWVVNPADIPAGCIELDHGDPISVSKLIFVH